MRLIIIGGIVLYMVAVWGTGTIQDFADMQKERQDRIEKILKGE